jgi:hypothetical protein
LRQLIDKQRTLTELKEYAVDHGLVLANAIIPRSNEVILRLDHLLDREEASITNDSDSAISDEHAPLLTDVDRCTIALAAIVAPAKYQQRYNKTLSYVGVGAGLIVIFLLVSVATLRVAPHTAAPIVATLLGLLGAVVYGLFSHRYCTTRANVWSS